MARIVWFHPRQLMPPRGGGDHRTLGLVRGALAADHDVLLVQPNDQLDGGQPPSGLTTAELDVRRGVSGALTKVFSADPLRAPRVTRGSVDRVRGMIDEFRPDLGVVSEVMTWGLARRLMPAVPWIYDSQNVEHELFEGHRQAALRLVDRVTFTVDHRRVTRAERALLRESAATLTVSDPDARGLREIAPSASFVLVPSSMEPPDVPADPVAAGAVMLFVGSLDFPPNIEAISALIHEIVPRVRERRPDASLLVIGRRPSATMRAQLDSVPWVEFLENAPSVDDAYRRARLVLMPFRSGSGTKLKLYEAMAFGMPVVATPKGIAGVDVRPDAEVLVRDDAAGIAAAAADVLEDQDLAGRLATAARRAFDERLSWEKAAHPVLRQVLAGLA